MKARSSKSMIFIGKSMLWSTLLYATLMLAFNWEDVRNTIKGRSAVTILSNPLPMVPVSEPAAHPASISANNQNVMLKILKDISGIMRIVGNIGSSYN